MNTYDAIMRAADHIEKNPSSLNYIIGRVPSTEYGPACHVGWIGYFSGYSASEESGDVSHNVCPQVLGVPFFEDGSGDTFCTRMEKLSSEPCVMWTMGKDVPRLLRLYATKYHAPSKPQRTDSELVADLVRKISSDRIPEEA